jgi:hypothetical protein
VELRSIEAVYLARDKGTGVALIRIEDKPPRGALVDFMREFGIVKPGAVVPLCWEQIWDYRGGQGDMPGLFRWPQFEQWLQEWPAELPAFHERWRRLFGMPGQDLADAAVVIWEER